MNRNLFLAILGMDSYNRGYGVGINSLDESGQLGNATLLAATNDQKAGWQTAGFYAIAYDMTGVAGFTAGERVIAYRGTDNPASDFYAYGIGLGQPFALTGGLTNQARLTIEIYRAVAGSGTDPFAANITTTGHSLGGGLAHNDNPANERLAA
jgi:hypothetical protein